MKIHLQATLFKVAFLILLLSFISAGSLFAQLNGLNYTINPGTAASATNYQSIADVVSDLKAGTRTDGGTVNGPGISGPVKITVTANTYTYSNPVDITAITGAGGHSGADSIIFDGGSAATSTLQITSPSGNNFLVQLDNCSYVTIENFTLTSTLAAGYNFWGVSVEGPNSGSPISHDDVINCTINMLADTVAVNIPSGAAFNGIVVSGWSIGDGVSQTIAGYFTNIYLTGNTINNGHFGIVAGGAVSATPSYNSGINIVGNTITAFSSIGVGLYSVINPKIRSNVINGGVPVLTNGANLGRGISMNTAYNSGITTDWTEISGNIITFAGRYGMLLNGACGTSQQPTRIFNNMVYLYSRTVTAANGISTLNSTFSPGNNYINFWNNSIVLNDSSTQAALTLVAGSTNSDIRNNILAYIGTSTGYPVSISAPSEVTAFDYNIFYNSATANEAFINSTAYTNTTVLNNNYGGSTTFNTHSVVTNPNFVSTTPGSQNLHITSQGTPGISIQEVTVDIDGQPRNNPPNIGADEIGGCSVPGNAGPISGTSRVCDGQQVTYSVAPISGATGYNWVVPFGDSIISGKNTNVITVLFGTSQLSGNILVNGTNNCGNGTGVNYPISPMQAPPVVITPAFDTLCSGNTVSLAASGAVSYVWSPNTALNNSTTASVGANPSNSITYTVTGTDVNGCTAGATSAIMVDVCTAIAPVATGGEISVFPNPSTGQFIVNLSKAIKGGKVEVFNITGQKVYNTDFMESNTQTIDLTGQGRGIYFLRVTDETGLFNTKIVVQ